MNVAKLARRGIGVSILCCLVLAADGSAATGICDRAPQVRDRILEHFPGSDCEDISDEDLTSIEILDLSDSEIGALKGGFRRFDESEGVELPGKRVDLVAGRPVRRPHEPAAVVDQQQRVRFAARGHIRWLGEPVIASHGQ